MDIENFICFCLKRGKRATFFRRKRPFFAYLLEVRQLKKARLQLGKIVFLIRDDDPNQSIIFPKIRIHFVNQMIVNKPRRVFEHIFLDNRIRHPYFWTAVIGVMLGLWIWSVSCHFWTSVILPPRYERQLFAPIFNSIFDQTLVMDFTSSKSVLNYETTSPLLFPYSK